jgi:hypothetical protein
MVSFSTAGPRSGLEEQVGGGRRDGGAEGEAQPSLKGRNVHKTKADSQQTRLRNYRPWHIWRRSLGQVLLPLDTPSTGSVVINIFRRRNSVAEKP